MFGNTRQLKAEDWFVAQLKPNGLALAQRNLARQGFAHFSPMREETVRQRGSALVAPRPLFPGYIFVQFDRSSQHWPAINATRGITRLLLNDPRKPEPLAPQFMAGLLARCDEREVLQAPDSLTTGDRIRVISGPFAEIVSTVESLEKDQRIQLLIDLMGQKVRVHVPVASVELLRD